MIESRIQRNILLLCDKYGILARPVEYRGRDSCPDVVILDPPTVWLEVKQPKGRVRPGQLREHQRMKEHGAAVYIVRSVEEADVILRRFYGTPDSSD